MSNFHLKKKSLRTSCTYSQYLVPACTVLENIKIKSRKIKAYPTKKQKKALKFLIGGYRYAYNQAVRYVKDLPKEISMIECKKGDYILKDEKYIFIGKGIGDYKIKHSFVPKFYTDKNGKEKKKNQTSHISIRNAIKKSFPDWSKDMNQHLIDCAFIEFSNNFTSSMNKIKDTGKPHIVKFKNKRKSYTETIPVEKSIFSSKLPNTIYQKVFKKFGADPYIETSEIFHRPTCDGKLTYDRRTKEWFFSIPKKHKKKRVKNREDIVSIDPGEKRFASIYSPSGEASNIVENNRQGKCLIYSMIWIDNKVG